MRHVTKQLLFATTYMEKCVWLLISLVGNNIWKFTDFKSLIFFWFIYCTDAWLNNLADSRWQNECLDCCRFFTAASCHPRGSIWVEPKSIVYVSSNLMSKLKASKVKLSRNLLIIIIAWMRERRKINKKVSESYWKWLCFH